MELILIALFGLGAVAIVVASGSQEPERRPVRVRVDRSRDRR
ncbi:hypothetical protein [Paralimibaculum aggregatum]|nr:hypothetical protein [Limibaculum sp. NKW23]